jgi:hypothetical protein
MSHLFTAAVWPKRDGDQMGYTIESDASLRAARMGAAIDDSRCGACGTDLSDDY